MSTRPSKAQSRISRSTTASSSAAAASSKDTSAKMPGEVPPSGNDLRAGSSEQSSRPGSDVRITTAAGTSGGGHSSSSASLFLRPDSPEPLLTIPDVHIQSGSLGADVPLLSFVAGSATSASASLVGKSRDMSSQSEIHFDPAHPLPEGQLMWKQAYDLIRLLRQYTCHHPGVLGNMEAMVQVHPICDDAYSSAWVPPPSSELPIPRWPLNTDWTGNEGDDFHPRGHVYGYHLINAAQESYAAG